jgi:hypothetical protein
MGSLQTTLSTAIEKNPWCDLFKPSTTIQPLTFTLNSPSSALFVFSSNQLCDSPFRSLLTTKTRASTTTAAETVGKTTHTSRTLVLLLTSMVTRLLG